MKVEFWAGNPRNNLMVKSIIMQELQNELTEVLPYFLKTNETYLTVELMDSNGNWKVLYTDASWETK